MGCIVEEHDDAIRVIGRKPLKPTRVKTAPYPGFPTDMQPQIATLLALADGTSMVTESIFENRFKYVDELARIMLPKRKTMPKLCAAPVHPWLVIGGIPKRSI